MQWAGYHRPALFLVLIPLSYAYVIHPRKLLKVGCVFNRFVVFFIIGLPVLAVSFLMFMGIAAILDLPSFVPVVGSAVAVVVALPSSGLPDEANRWVSRTLYRAYYDHASVAGGLSGRLAQALALFLALSVCACLCLALVCVLLQQPPTL